MVGTSGGLRVGMHNHESRKLHGHSAKVFEIPTNYRKGRCLPKSARSNPFVVDIDLITQHCVNPSPAHRHDFVYR
jgi:hypothetical protein